MGLVYDAYIAAPFFNIPQLDRLQFIEETLTVAHMTYYSPMRECFVQPDASEASKMQAFQNNLIAIANSRVVVACTDDKDMGTLFEAGYAYRLDKPIVYLALTLGKKPFNLMLAESAFRVFTDRDSFTIFIARDLYPAMRDLHYADLRVFPAHLVSLLGAVHYGGKIE